MPDLTRFDCVPYSDAGPDGSRFYVRAATDQDAVRDASAEARANGFTHVFIEDNTCRQVHDGPLQEIAAT
ncbi:hypothetical protein [Croceicoccus gelatinilyticus]|uniref:hypothetical protein n=1 Tax=Croceicoccus gelatinilyticus TaxID=2835536 RepID=UPI001BD00356|nr:hypothetical protein [Croceicoccus gelatinilyticus]MBS7671757.1 hypothetical protein [Croceicoccus gelatinilyticus]